MPDFDVEFQGDFGLTPDGDLAMVDGLDLDNQHIARRLFTNTNGVLWHPEYGAGLRQRIGRPALARVIQAIVRQQIYLEAAVARLPVPVIGVTTPSDNPGLYVVSITYTNAITGREAAISLEIPTNR